jgi:hypothetical protein
MPKKKKSKKVQAGSTGTGAASTAGIIDNVDPVKKIKNPLLIAQTQFLESLPPKLRQKFFSNQHIDPSTRAEVWSRQAELGEQLVNDHSWATPDARCMKILKHFGQKIKKKSGSSGGIVEIGCGANAYWARMMFRHKIDVMAFDFSLVDGGKITDMEKDGGSKQAKSSTTSKSKKRRRQVEKKTFDDGFVIHRGGPEVLALNKEAQNRALFLCYPDEDVMEGDRSSMGAACLEDYKGDTIIHVGELFGDTPSMDQAPWGRSSGPEFQQRLAAEYHCVLKAKLTNWLHVHDTISVWKRTELCSIVFQGDEDDDEDSDEEVEYRHIPKNELLPSDIAAPCCKHLLE